jgi:hypothetical protein
MFGTMRCVYETPCHWCSKWDKKCDERLECNTERKSCNDPSDANVDISKLLKKKTNEDILSGKGLKKI